MVGIDPPDRASQVPAQTAITATFSEPVDPASVQLPGAVQLSVIRAQGSASGAQGPGEEIPVPGRVSLGAGNTTLIFTPTDPLEADALYRFALSGAVTDGVGTALEPFESTFTTAARFTAEALPPGTLQVSLPEDDLGQVVPRGVTGKVFVCGGAQITLPATDVIVESPDGSTVTTAATDNAGTSLSEVCDALFPGRCNTDQPGSFCAVLDAALGDRILVHIRDAFGNEVVLDAGNMTDERTGATAVGPEGATVTFPEDPRYQAFVPEGAFDQPTVVELTPIEPDPAPGSRKLDLLDPDHPEFEALLNPELDSYLDLLGAVRIDLDPPDAVAQVNFDVSVPYPDPVPADAASAQYLATQVISFRSDAAGTPRHELTMVDSAHFDAETQRVVTDPTVFAGLRQGGTFGLQRSEICLGFVTGYVSTGDYFGEPAGFVGGSLLGAMLPFPVDQNDRLRFTVPLPCNTPVQVALRDINGNDIDSGCGCSATYPPPADDGNCRVAQGEVATLQCTLSDDTEPPSAGSFSVRDGDEDVDPLRPLEVSFDEPIDPSSLTEDSFELLDSRGRKVEGLFVLSPDGSSVTFLPDIRLKYGEHYTLTVSGVLDLAGNPLDPITVSFTTFEPRILAHIPDVDARGVVWLDPGAWPDPEAVGLTICSDLIAVAEGDSLVPDFEGGLKVYDVSDLSQAPVLVASQATAGVDRALGFAAGPPVTTTGSGGQTFDGPFLMSVDGPGGSERFGAWRLSDLSEFPALRRVGTRIINQSAESMVRISGVDDPLAPPSPYNLLDLAAFVPNNTGVPLDVASFGTEIAYIANSPHIGLQVIVPSGMNTDPLAEDQVHGTLRGDPDASFNYDRSFPIRAVDTLAAPDPQVLAVSQEGSDNKLLLIDPQLTARRDEYDLTTECRPLAVTGLKAWPTRMESHKELDTNQLGCLAAGFPPEVCLGEADPSLTACLAVNPPEDCNGSDTTDTAEPGLPHYPTEPRDISVVLCQGDGVRTVGVDATTGSFNPSLIPGGEGTLHTPGGSPRGAVADPKTQLLYVADGTAGLTIIDLARPGGRIDEDGDGIDDRVLGTVPLPAGDGTAARAVKVAFDVDQNGHTVAAVAAAEGGAYVIDLGPSPRGVYLESVPRGGGNSRVRVEEVRYFNEKDSTFYEPVVEMSAASQAGSGETVQVELTALDVHGEQVHPPQGTFAPAQATVTLQRIPGTARYHINPDGTHKNKVVVSNLPLDELRELGCPKPDCTPIYGGFGGSLVLHTLSAGTPAGCGSEVPIEKVDVIVLAVDGLRQDVLYPSSEEQVKELSASYDVNPHHLPGFGQVLGGHLNEEGTGVNGVLDWHHIRLGNVSAIFPSITLASWASIFTGAPPKDTGITGNEFFARTEIEGLSHQRNNPVITLSEGAWGRTIGETLNLTPPGLFRYEQSDPLEADQNRPGLLSPGAPTLFEQLRGETEAPPGDQDFLDALRQRFPPGSERCGREQSDGMAVMTFNHYARGASCWLTLTALQEPKVPLTADGLDSIPADNAIDYLKKHLTTGGKLRNAQPFPAFFTLYLAGLDHAAHEGHGPHGEKYREYLQQHLDGHVARFVQELKDIGEFYNKVFFLTADHGHTRISDDADEHYPCKVTLGFGDELERMWESRGRKPELEQNNNLHIWELAKILAAGNELQDVFRPTLLVPGDMLGIKPLEPKKGDWANVTAYLKEATLVTALNGAMAHLYLRPEGADWATHPTERELGIVAEVLRLFLTDGQRFINDGPPILEDTHHPAFPPNAHELLMAALTQLDTTLERLVAGADVILVRPDAESDYFVFNGLQPSTDPTDVHMDLLPVDQVLTEPTYVNAAERIRDLNHSERSGDIIIVMRDRTEESAKHRFTTGPACRGWHASLNRSDSYVPFILSYPGGNASEMATLRKEICTPAEQGAPNPCRWNWILPKFVKSVFRKEYLP